jgi:cysteine desulfurase/selenocysteine lyase
MTGTSNLDVAAIRAEFPILEVDVRGKALVYLDNAATTQKPRRVIDRISQFYLEENANSHRAVHFLSERATRAFEEARVKIARFINAPDTHEVIFTRGTTESINLVASSWGRANLNEGDEIILTAVEHHSNIVPWQLIAEQRGAIIKVVPVFDNGELDLEAYENLFTERTKMVAVVHLSNTLGTINPVREMIVTAHNHGALVLLDAAQSVPHIPIDVQELGADFIAFSGHKIYAPTGIGVLWAKREHLEAMPPYHGGGNMISRVSFEKTTWNDLPYKFEAGTGHMAGVIGLGEATDWLNEVGLDNIAAHEADLMQHVTTRSQEIKGLRIIGEAKNKASVFSFVIEGLHPNDIGHIVDTQGVAIRTGHHCTMPLMERFGLPATCRASFAAYNTHAEVDAFINSLEFAREMLA